MHINFTVSESSCGHEIVRAERSGYKREVVVVVVVAVVVVVVLVSGSNGGSCSS